MFLKNFLLQRYALRVFLCTLMLICSLYGGLSFAASATVYEAQKPITDSELVRFMELLPRFRAWAISSREEAHPSVTAAGEPDFVYSANAAAWVRERGWEPVRFFCVMGRAAAALAIVAEGDALTNKLPPDMPEVKLQEIDLVRRHLGSLLKAGNDAPPITRE